MFSNSIKKFGIVCCMGVLCSCSLFSDKKDLPTGKRIAIIDSKYSYDNISNKSISNIPSINTISSWTQSGANSYHVIGNLSGNDDMKKIWSANFGEGSDKRNLLLSQPLIIDSIVYTQDVKGTVSAFDIKNGQKIWKKKIKPDNKNLAKNGLNGVGLASDTKNIFAVTGFGSVVSFDAKTGKKLWQTEINTPIRTAPSVCGDKLIVQTLDNKLFVLDTDNGSEIFKYTTPFEDTVLAGGATPACSTEKDIIVAGFSNGQIEAFKASLGYPLWSASLVNNKRGHSTTNINAIKASPVIDNDIIYAIGNNDMLAAIDYNSGETVWSQEIGSVNTPYIAGDYIYILSNNNEIICLEKNSGKIIFNIKLLTEYDIEDRSEIYLTGPIMINNKLLVSASNGTIYVISSVNGAVERKFDIGNDLPFSPISAQNSIIFTNSDADIIMYK